MDDVRECEQAAIRLLAQREHSRQELLRKLRRKCSCDEAAIAHLLDKLKEMGYQDDIRYAEMFVRSSVARGRGPQRIAYDLRERGVDESVASQMLAQADIDWHALATEQRERKFGREKPADYKERARQSRFLAGRGFYMDTIKAVFQCLPDETEGGSE